MRTYSSIAAGCSRNLVTLQLGAQATFVPENHFAMLLKMNSVVLKQGVNSKVSPMKGSQNL